MPATPLTNLPSSAPDRAASQPLSELAPGASAVVDEIAADSGLAQRLMELGFVPETRVEVLRRAPLGDPTVYRLRGYQICLRRGEAERIRVRRA